MNIFYNSCVSQVSLTYSDSDLLSAVENHQIIKNLSRSNNSFHTTMTVLMVLLLATTTTIHLVVHTVHNVVSLTMTCYIIIKLHREHVPSLRRTLT